MRHAVSRASLVLVAFCAGCLSPPPDVATQTKIGGAADDPSLFRDEDELRHYVERTTRMRSVVEEHALKERLAALRAARRAAGMDDPWASESDAGWADSTWPDSMEGVETWVVTGTGSASNQLIASSSVSTIAFDSAELSALGASSVSDVAAYAPNLEIAGDTSITNNQEVGVDEGDIVKRMGDFIVLLRRGRLYSLDIGSHPGAAIRVVDREDVFPFPQEHHAWYDELLVSGNSLVVLGYSYSAGGTEIALFEIDRHGRLFHVETYAIRSNDYYSWENYGARLVDGRLVFYLPIDLEGLEGTGDSYWPSYSTYGWLGLRNVWRPLVESMQIQRPIQASFPTTLHAVVQCSIGDLRLDCEAEGVVGHWDATHYVSRTAFYLWIGGGRSAIDSLSLTLDDLREMLARGDSLVETGAPDAFLYRLPFDGSTPGAVAISGEPDDQLAFRERNDQLEVLLVTQRGARSDLQRLALARIDLDRFSEPDAEIRPDDLLPLPEARRPWSCMNHRFVGDHLLYSSCDTSLPSEPVSGVFVHELEGEQGTDWIEIAGSIRRIERLGSDALVVGERSDDDAEAIALTIRPVLLGDEIEVPAGTELPFLVEAESRSHAFNFTRWAEAMLFGLPAQHLEIVGWSRPPWASRPIPELRTTGLISYFTMTETGSLEEIGRIPESESNKALDDDCEISCVDWYGSMRPFFIEGRIFALLDYELVEAEIRVGRLREIQRAAALRD